GILFIISSPSGGGKGTLIREVLETVPNVGYSISFTTRLQRTGEKHGREYFFVTPAEFEKMRQGGAFLEWAQVHNHFYGTAHAQVEIELKAGRDIILEIDVQGAKNVKNLLPESVGIFIMPPSFEILSQRLEARGSENSTDLAVRLLNARGEVEHYRYFDYLIINDEVERAATQLAAVFLAERARRTRMQPAVEEILQTFSLTD
ncbi:MAG: guanylate kinase, partial [Pyrinomonadaceae bacterium]